MNGAHETLDNAELVIDNLGQRGEAVGRAGGVGDLALSNQKLMSNIIVFTYDSVFRFVGVQVDTDDEHGGICGRRRDDDLLGATLQVG